MTNWGDSEAAIRAVRTAVFVEEQGIPDEAEWDDADRTCDHVVAVDADGVSVGTGRLLDDGRIGRLAVLQQRRQQGIGDRMLAAIMDRAKARGFGAVYLHAQTHAISFYGRHGFVAEGAEFMEDGILHVKMTCALRDRGQAEGEA